MINQNSNNNNSIEVIEPNTRPKTVTKTNSFLNKRKFGLTINCNNDHLKKDTTNIYIIDPDKNELSIDNSNNNTSNSPVNNNNQQQQQQNVNSISSKFKLNTKLQLPLNNNNNNNNNIYDDEPLGSSRWLGCNLDSDKIKIYDSICSKVNDYLYMGSETIASDFELLKRNGITHIINASFQCENYFENHPDHPFIYKKFPLKDTFSEDISLVFPQVIEFIEKARAANGKIFIHCQMGISRSPCLCMLWIMHSSRCSLDDASDAIRSARPISRPNAGFQICLMNWAIKEGLQEPNSFRSLSSLSPSSTSNVSTSPSSTSSSLISSNNSSPILSPLVSPKLSMSSLSINTNSPRNHHTHFNSILPSSPKSCKIVLPTTATTSSSSTTPSSNLNLSSSSNSIGSTSSQQPTSPSCAPSYPFSQNSIPLSTTNIIDQ